MFPNIILNSIFKKDCGVLCAMKKPQTLIMRASKSWILRFLIVHENGNRKKYYLYVKLFKTFI